MLQIYNSMTRKKEEFVPLEPGQVKMYVCGPTVYNFLHVGNFRGPVFFNLVRNWLEKSGYKVKFALNFTDVDDRIIEKAKTEGVSSSEISERYIAEYKTDYASLGLRPHDLNPKVTDSMKSIEELVQELIKRGKAYEIKGEVLYSVRAFEGYGKLSNRNMDELQSGARVEIDQKKKDPLDFALWKPAKPGEASWPSQWGAGRPGWHIECSAMIKEIFGDQIDIHGGGTDLMFPHHENEIAQSEGASGQRFVRYWIHHNMLNFSGQKMSKSIGNIVRLRDFVKDYHPEIYKYMILSAHYRSVSDFGDATIEKTIRELARFYSALKRATDLAAGKNVPTELAKFHAEIQKRVESSLNDDFNTPEVMAALFDLVRHFNNTVKPGAKVMDAHIMEAQNLLAVFRNVAEVTALFSESPKEFLLFLDEMLLSRMNLKREDINRLVEERWQAKQTKNFARSDEIRKQLTEMGISVMDTGDGSSWEVAK